MERDGPCSSGVGWLDDHFGEHQRSNAERDRILFVEAYNATSYANSNWVSVVMPAATTELRADERCREGNLLDDRHGFLDGISGRDELLDHHLERLEGRCAEPATSSGTTSDSISGLNRGPRMDFYVPASTAEFRRRRAGCR